VGTSSYTISPGFDKVGEPPRLERDLARWQQNVADMVASGASLQLVTTFNEWGEGTAVESAAEWASASGYGAYLDALHNNGPEPTVVPAVLAAPANEPSATAGQGAFRIFSIAVLILAIAAGLVLMLTGWTAYRRWKASRDSSASSR
jgi:hypothetical protein